MNKEDKSKDHSELWTRKQSEANQGVFFTPGQGPSKYLSRILDLSWTSNSSVPFTFPLLDRVMMNDEETTVHYPEILGFEFDAVIVWKF